MSKHKKFVTDKKYVLVQGAAVFETDGKGNTDEYLTEWEPCTYALEGDTIEEIMEKSFLNTISPLLALIEPERYGEQKLFDEYTNKCFQYMLREKESKEKIG